MLRGQRRELWAPGRAALTVSPQLLANAVVFLGGNLAGAFHKRQMQGAARELFTYTVKCIQIRRKLRVEKRQQVGPPLPCGQRGPWSRCAGATGPDTLQADPGGCVCAPWAGGST